VGLRSHAGKRDIKRRQQIDVDWLYLRDAVRVRHQLTTLCLQQAFADAIKLRGFERTCRNDDSLCPSTLPFVRRRQSRSCRIRDDVPDARRPVLDRAGGVVVDRRRDARTRPHRRRRRRARSLIRAARQARCCVGVHVCFVVY
jgi:hypothetical protein